MLVLVSRADGLSFTLFAHPSHPHRYFYSPELKRRVICMDVGFGDFRNAGRNSEISDIQRVSAEILVTLNNAKPCFRTWIILCVAYSSFYFLIPATFCLRFHHIYVFTYRFLPFLTTHHRNTTPTALFCHSYRLLF